MISPSAVPAVNASAVAGTTFSIMGWLPPAVAFLATLLTCAWMLIQIWDSGLVKRFRARHQSKKEE